MIDRDFQGQLGQSANGDKIHGFDQDASRSKYVNYPNTITGKILTLLGLKKPIRCCEMSIKKGGTGFGAWGGLLWMTKKYKGDIFTFDIGYILPSSFKTTVTPGLKFLRFYTINPSGTNAGTRNGGALDIAILPNGTGFALNKEKQNWVLKYKHLIPRDKPFRLTGEVSVDNVSRDNGGNSYVKLYLDGQLVFDEGRIQTLDQPQDYYNKFLMHTHFNGGSPKDQKSYVTKIKIGGTTKPIPSNPIPTKPTPDAPIDLPMEPVEDIPEQSITKEQALICLDKLNTYVREQ